MFVTHRIWVDRLLVGGLVLLTAGLGGALYVVLSPAPLAPDQVGDEPRAGAPLVERARSLSEADLSVVWRGLDPGRPPPRPAGRGRAANPDRPDKGRDGLPFRLRGIVYSTAGSSVAFIETGKIVQIYRAGEKIGEWEITAIDMYAVTFSRDGKPRVMAIAHKPFHSRPGRALAGGAGDLEPTVTHLPARRVAKRRDVKRAVTVQTTMTTYPNRRAKPAAAPSWPKRTTVSVPSELVKQVRRNPQAALQGARFEPLMEKGQMRGIRIQKLPALGVGYGLAAGDVVRAVEGKQIDSFDRAFDLYSRYRSYGSIRVTVERNGRLRDLIFHSQ